MILNNHKSKAEQAPLCRTTDQDLRLDAIARCTDEINVCLTAHGNCLYSMLGLTDWLWALEDLLWCPPQ